MPIIPVITGATATGKSNIITELVAEEGADYEIVSADAFQVYKRLDIGTAKATAALRAILPHHLVDILEPDGSFNAGDFVEKAEAAIADILARGKKPVVVGGTGLYIRSLRDGMFYSPDIDESLKQELRARMLKDGSEKLHAELAVVDPKAASQVHSNDQMRILRALEVWHATGIAISEARETQKTFPAYKYKVMVLEKDRELLYQDIDARVVKMIEAGWLAEVKGLLDDGYTADLPSFRAIGYADLAEVLLNGRDPDQAVITIARKTRNFAKRQLTWFRGMADVCHMSVDEIKNSLK